LTAIGNTANWTTTDTRISTFPSWTFSVAGASIEPTAQATNLTFSTIKTYKYDVSFTAANPAPTGYLVLRAVNAYPSFAPVDGSVYAVGNTIGNAKIVSLGATTSFLQESVVANTSYGYSIYAYNVSGNLIDYLQANPLQAMVTTNANEIGTYYSAVSPSASTFVTDLKNRVRSPYTKISYDQYDETMVTHYAISDTTNGQKVATCVYSGEKYAYTPPFTWYTSSPFSREHTWCVSWMPSNATSSFNEYCDQHHLYPVVQSNANAVRSNHPLGTVTTVISSYLLGKYGYNANGELVYEPANAHKGDAARALLYMSLRYDGVSGFDWTFNYLNTTILPSLSEAPQDIALLIQWHNQDPPDNYEIARNDYVQSLQQNRNPFVDNPSWVNYINFANLSWIAPAGMRTDENNTATTTKVESDIDMLVFPNPAQEISYLTIHSSVQEQAILRVSDVYGRLVAVQNISLMEGTNNTEIELGALPDGYYFISLNTSNTSITKSLMKH
jgi:hypothetical protein